MIQRIQSVFLFLSAASILGLFGAPFAYTQDAAPSGLFADKIYNINDHDVLLALFLLSGVLTLLSIFLFKNRSLQMKAVLLSMLLLIGAIAFAGILYFQVEVEMIIRAGFGLLLPILGMIFAILAYRFIRKDEKLVRSMDRLR